MSKLPEIRLKPDRERSVISRHPWIFSGAIEGKADCEDGVLVRVSNSSGQVVGGGYYNSQSSIRVRLLCFSDEDPQTALINSLENAIQLRERFKSTATDGCRLVNAEGDNIPGLIVDKYRDELVLQVSTLGIERQKEKIVSWLLEHLKPTSIYERSHSPSRREEGLGTQEGSLYGKTKGVVEFSEYGSAFFADIPSGQKTGFFLDQREMRRLVESVSENRRVLNCFSYSGAFSVFAARGGAKSVESVDSSEGALQLAKKTFSLNELAPQHAYTTQADVFDFLRGKNQQQQKYNLIILDPPAFVKNKNQIESGSKGYRDINEQAFRLLEKRGLLLTCSCSHFVDSELFQRVIFQAAREVKRPVRILSKHRVAFDHPVNLFHPEGDYLKSLLLEVD